MDESDIVEGRRPLHSGLNPQAQHIGYKLSDDTAGSSCTFEEQITYSKDQIPMASTV